MRRLYFVLYLLYWWSALAGEPYSWYLRLAWQSRCLRWALFSSSKRIAKRRWKAHRDPIVNNRWLLSAGYRWHLWSFSLPLSLWALDQCPGSCLAKFFRQKSKHLAVLPLLSPIGSWRSSSRSHLSTFKTPLAVPALFGCLVVSVYSVSCSPSFYFRKRKVNHRSKSRLSSVSTFLLILPSTTKSQHTQTISLTPIRNRRKRKRFFFYISTFPTTENSRHGVEKMSHVKNRATQCVFHFLLPIPFFFCILQVVTFSELTDSFSFASQPNYYSFGKKQKIDFFLVTLFCVCVCNGLSNNIHLFLYTCICRDLNFSRVMTSSFLLTGKK